MKKINLIAVWILGIIVFAAAIAVAQYYYYITPPSDLRISPNECFNKSTQTQIEKMINSNLAIHAYNELSTNDQENTTVTTIQNTLNTSLTTVLVNDINHSTGRVICGATYNVQVKSPDGSKVIATSKTTGIFYLQGNKNGIEYLFPGHVITSLYNHIKPTN